MQTAEERQEAHDEGVADTLKILIKEFEGGRPTTLGTLYALLIMAEGETL